MKSSDFWTEEQKAKAKKQGLKRLNKIMPIYIGKIEKLSYQMGYSYYCYYVESGVVKYAIISNPYVQRYGPNVIATLKGKSPVGLWQVSKDAITDADYQYMLMLAVDGKLDLPIINLEEFTFES